MRVRRELRVAAYGLCVRDDAVLLARYLGRNSYSGHGGHEWTLPGGGLEHGEDPRAAVVREVEEETGYEVEIERLLLADAVRRTFPRGRWRVADHHAVRILYAVRVTGGALRHEVGGSTDLAAWMPIDRLDELAPVRADTVDTGLALSGLRAP
jgi:ADP-ribose pyrophosphatase YjhB (NUDIX family)